MDRTIFAGEFHLRDADIAGSLVCQGVTFEGIADFTRTRVASATFFGPSGNTCSEFKGEARFYEASLGRGADFHGAHFAKLADFGGLRVDGRLDFWSNSPKRQVVFEGEFVLRDAQISSGLRCRGAQFKGDAFFDRISVGGPAIFGPDKLGQPVTFEKSVRFVQAHLQGEVNFNCAQFLSSADFSTARMEGEVFFKTELPNTRTSFGGEVSFNGAVAEQSVTFRGAHFKDKAEFNRFQVRGSAYFDPDMEKNPTVFEKTARFIQSHIAGEANFSRVKFHKSATFDSAQIGGPARFNATTIDKEARFVGMRFGAEALFRSAQMGDETRFDRAVVEGPIDFGPDGVAPEVEFGGRSNFSRMEVKGFATFDGCRFGGYADFFGMKVGGQLSFRPSAMRPPASGRMVVFEDGASFNMIAVQGPCDWRGAQFMARKEIPQGGQTDWVDADMGSMKLESRVSMGYFQTPLSDNDDPSKRRTTFFGSVRFNETSIKASAFLTGTYFCGDAAFARVNFGGPVWFTKDKSELPTLFKGLADFRAANFASDANFVFCRFEDKAQFFGARFDKDADYTAACFSDLADFRAASVAARATFVNTEFHKLVDLRDAKVAVIVFRHFDSSGEDKLQLQSIDLRGLTYSRIYGDWSKLLGSLRVYDRQPYTQFETSLRATGEDQIADNIYLARRKRENQRDRETGKPRLAVFADRLFGILGGYGVDLAVISRSLLALFLLGAIVFSLPGALKQSAAVFSGASPSLGDSIAISIRELVPFNTSLAADWKVSGSAAAYALVHKILGSTLLSLWVAALIGLLHRRSK